MAEVVPETRRDEYTKDGTVDLTGKPVFRSNTGRWTACSFIVVYEVFERMAYYGISSNLILYLTNKLRQGTVRSANNVTNWVGTSWMLPILGAYVADAHLGRYWTFVISSVIYLSGMILLTLAVSLPALKPPSCHLPTDNNGCEKKASTVQLGVFFLALYVIAIGTGGTKPNISTIGADQFDVFDPREKKQKLSFFNWWMFSIFLGTLFANTFLVYVQDNVGWTLGYALPTAGLLLSILVFLVGTRFYRHKGVDGISPFAKMARTIVAAGRKWKVELPEDSTELYELDADEYGKKGKYRIKSTPTLRMLNRAAVKTGETSPWMLSPVTQIEETKQILRMIPILIVTFVPSAMLAQVNTLFVKQGTTLDRRIGPNFKVPPASLAAFITVSMLIFVAMYDRFLVPLMRRFTGKPQGISLLQRIGTGFVIHIVIMLVASFTERYRLSAARHHGVVDTGDQVPLTIFVLLPQFLLMGVADAFLETGKIEFFYDQAPESMKSLGTSFSSTTLGVGNFLSSFLLSTVERITSGPEKDKGWIRNNLNASRLDHYYMFFALLNFVNFLLFLVFSRTYEYRAEVDDDELPPAVTLGGIGPEL